MTHSTAPLRFAVALQNDHPISETIADARQKEMNVSITEDATISRTRSDGGATVVRVEAIVKVPARRPANYIQWAQLPAALR